MPRTPAATIDPAISSKSNGWTKHSIFFIVDPLSRAGSVCADGTRGARAGSAPAAHASSLSLNLTGQDERAASPRQGRTTRDERDGLRAQRRGRGDLRSWHPRSLRLVLAAGGWILGVRARDL